ncbi:MAG: hypothetical protein R3A45_04045 [Bdellovibrionota bacterium]
MLDYTTQEGEHTRKLTTLTTTRAGTPLFKLSWTVNHIIDEDSPLFHIDITGGELLAIIVIVTGHDGTSNTIYSRHHYIPEDIIQNRYFKDIIHKLPNGRLMINYDDFHSLKP